MPAYVIRIKDLDAWSAPWTVSMCFGSFLVLFFSFSDRPQPYPSVHWVCLSFVPFGWQVMVVFSFKTWIYAMILARVQISASGIQVDVRVVMYYGTSSSTFSSEESFEFRTQCLEFYVVCSMSFWDWKNNGDLPWWRKPWKKCFDLPFLSGCSLWTDVILTCSQWSSEQT